MSAGSWASPALLALATVDPSAVSTLVDEVLKPADLPGQRAAPSRFSAATKWERLERRGVGRRGQKTSSNAACLTVEMSYRGGDWLSMHSHSLHHPVIVECQCCHVDQEFIFTSRSDHVICKSCVRHQGDTTRKASQRDADHVGLWRSELGLVREAHASEVEQLRGELKRRDQELAGLRVEISDLKAVVRDGVENASPLTVDHWWASEKVTEAMTSRDQAYRSRDHAYRALWAVDRLHREDDTRAGFCGCGRAG